MLEAHCGRHAPILTPCYAPQLRIVARSIPARIVAETIDAVCSFLTFRAVALLPRWLALKPCYWNATTLLESGCWLELYPAGALLEPVVI